MGDLRRNSVKIKWRFRLLCVGKGLTPSYEEQPGGTSLVFQRGYNGAAVPVGTRAVTGLGRAAQRFGVSTKGMCQARRVLGLVSVLRWIASSALCRRLLPPRE